MADADPEIKKALNDFALTRAAALNTYAALEQSLAGLFSTLMGAQGKPVDIRKSYLVFAQILSYRHRRVMLTNLIKIEYGDQYDVFTKSLMKRLGKVEDQRNKVVHWIVLSGTPGGEKFNAARDIALHQHPNIFGPDKMTKTDLELFTSKSLFLKDLVFNFDFYLKWGSAMPNYPSMATWPEIFQRPVDYPLPSDHPLSQTHTEPSGQPQS
ncbi:MAG: hypothetical protein HY242_01095 [Afipia sp.]|nr:hypothetical protein [Afipia sp.]